MYIPEPENPGITSPLAADCWYLTGPTASGKTRTGIELARRIDAEIISLDSMAVYRDMDIGTAKPTADERQAVPHHLVDIRDPDETFSAAEYIETANATIQAIQARGKQVLFVGGTPMYLKTLLRGLFEGPPADWDFRREVEKEIDAVGIEALHQRLEQIDPLTAARLHPNDRRRIIRALEVYRLTGRPISHQQTHFDEGRPADRCRVFALAWPRPTLHQRIAARVDRMFAAGWIDEVRRLLDQYELSRTATQAVGYREIIEHVRGDYDQARTIERVKTRTRQFAKRQETWFRSLSECRRIEMTDNFDPSATAAVIAAAVA